MLKRWYDTNATLSMAVSLLHNTTSSNRLLVTRAMNEATLAIYPEISAYPVKKRSIFALLQKRTTMEVDAWCMIENLKHLSEVDRQGIALRMINMIYYLENAQQFEDPYDELLRQAV